MISPHHLRTSVTSLKQHTGSVIIPFFRARYSARPLSLSICSGLVLSSLPSAWLINAPLPPPTKFRDLAFTLHVLWHLHLAYQITRILSHSPPQLLQKKNVMNLPISTVCFDFCLLFRSTVFATPDTPNYLMFLFIYFPFSHLQMVYFTYSIFFLLLHVFLFVSV